MRGLSGLISTAFRRWIYPRHPHVLQVRDTTGAYRELSVGYVLHRGQLRIALGVDDQPPILLRQLQVGWLRGRLREAAISGADDVTATDVDEEVVSQ